MKKDLAYYMGLKYRIKLEKIPSEEGGGWNASIPLLGSYLFQGDGETPEEAIADLEQFKGHMFKRYIEREQTIPEPKQGIDDV